MTHANDIEKLIEGGSAEKFCSYFLGYFNSNDLRFAEKLIPAIKALAEERDRLREHLENVLNLIALNEADARLRSKIIEDAWTEIDYPDISTRNKAIYTALRFIKDLLFNMDVNGESGATITRHQALQIIGILKPYDEIFQALNTEKKG